MKEAVFVFGAGLSDNGECCFGSNTLPLKLRQNAPPGFPNSFALPLLFPIANRSGRNPIRPGNNDKHTARPGVGELAVAFVAVAELLRRFRPAQVSGHGRVA